MYLSIISRILESCRMLIFSAFAILFALSAQAQNATNLSITDQVWSANLPSGATRFDLYPSNNACTLGDVNGDAATDIICVNQGTGTGQTSPTATVPSSVMLLESTKSSATGFSGSAPIGTITADSAGSIAACAVADFDGDGRSDLACFYSGSSGFAEGSPTVWFSKSAPFSLAVNDSSTAIPLSETSGGQTTYFNSFTIHPFGSSCTVGHFMAGAGDQILCNYPRALPSLATNIYYLWRFQAYAVSSSSESITETGGVKPGASLQWTGPSHTTTTGPYANFGSNCLTGDFNGDGLTDVACPDGTGNWNMGLSTGNGFSVSSWSTSDHTFHSDCSTGDFNGDGKTDIACYVDSNPSYIDIYLSTGVGFQPEQTWSFPGMPAAQNLYNTTPRNNSVFSTICSTGDLNGDGKTDLLCYSNNPNNTADWVYALSTGSSFQVGHLTSVQPPYANIPPNYTIATAAEPFAGPCTLGDFIATGLAHLLCYNNIPTGTTTNYVLGILSRQ